MHKLPGRRLTCIFAAALFASSPVLAQTPRFAAQFASGKRLTGAEIRNWHEPRAEPQLDSVKLLAPEDRALWAEDVSLPPAAAPVACVEFFGGDRLPGRVTAFRDGNDSSLIRVPPCVIVIPAASVDWPDVRRPSIPVAIRWLKRVVWQKRDDDRYRPGTLYFLDGRQVEFRSVRWQSSAVRLLIDQETRDVPFDQIAELHLPQLDPWDAWFHQLAALLPDLSGWLVQVETADGLRATASTQRLLPSFRGDGGNPDHWYQACQPAWSIESLWLKHRTIRTRRFFAPHEVPLSAIEPARSVSRSSLSGGWTWQLDRTVQAQPLRCADQAWGWGLGVHAYSELTYNLPACARVFRTQYGLDGSAGLGGCVRAVIIAGPPAGPVIHRSGHVIGTEKSYDSGPLGIVGVKQLTLLVDPAQDDRPAGADPFEIRDSFVWLQPMIELDVEPLRAEIERRVSTPLSSWAGWTIGNTQVKPCLVSHAWIPRPAPFTRCRAETAPRDGFVSISRKLRVGERDRFLALAVSRLEKDVTPSRIQVRLAGRAAAEFDVPVHNAAIDPDPLLVPVDRYRGQTIDVELVQFALAPQSRIEWRGMTLTDRDPVAFELFEDDLALVKNLTDGAGTAFLDAREKYLGSASLRVANDDRGNPALAGWNIPIRGEPNPGEYRFLRFVWKKRGGKQLGLHLARGGAFPPAEEPSPRESLRYHFARSKEKDYGASVQLRDQPPDQWELVTRDLWTDFGPFDLTGLRFVCGDGESAWFDHIYLARAPHDLDRVTARLANPPPNPLTGLPPDVQANLDFVAVEPARFGQALAAIAPQFSTAASEQGVWLYKTYQGKQNVVRTHPPAQGQPCILRAPLAVPAGKRAELRLTVTHHPQADWQLVVLAGGERLHDSLVSAEQAKDGWAEFTIDLSRFAGRSIALEVHNHPNNWANEFAYWARAEIVYP
ncbi:MAG: NPCBM/NEW2 domain-containing protein [Planctomycetia bacterium]|nr:NPCBM/NEW2 domain-containing protein [Planctomycetia bacterium]